VRIIYVVDVHGHTRLVARAVAAATPIDVLIVGGDITTAGTADDAEHAIAEWRSLVPRLLVLAGNMDSPEIDARLAELGVALDQRAFTLDDIGVYGLSGAPISPLTTPYELSEDELARRIAIAYEQLGDPRVRIFCPHTPPYATKCDRLANGQHVGSTAVRHPARRHGQTRRAVGDQVLVRFALASSAPTAMS
jgi:uncharacterized protein